VICGLPGSAASASSRSNLDRIEEQVGPDAGEALRSAIEEARRATAALVAWLEAQAPSKNGPSGIGRENYTWYQQNVHLVPMTLGGRGAAAEARTRPGLVVAEARRAPQPQAATAGRTPPRRRNTMRWPSARPVDFLMTS
jgi:hypothetical protein